MKKQILTLMLSAVVFTTNPLFAMKPDDEDSGLGAFKKTPKDITVRVLEYLNPKDLNSALRTSKPMYNICGNEFWTWMNSAKNLPISINPISSLKTRIEDFLCVFSDPKKNYSISMDMLQFFRKNRISNTNPVAYRFHIGNNAFHLVDMGEMDVPQDNLFVQKPINYSLFDKNARVIFALSPKKEYFESHFTLVSNTDRTVGGVVDEDSKTSYIFEGAADIEDGVPIDADGIPIFSPEHKNKVLEVQQQFPEIQQWNNTGCHFRITKTQD